MLQGTSGKPVFECDMILYNPFIHDLDPIIQLKEKILGKNNQRISKNSKPHIYNTIKSISAKQKGK